MKKRINLKTMLIAISLAFTCLTTAAFAVPNDSVALGDLTEGKILFDINLSAPESLPLYLSVIKETYDGLEAQGVTPDFVIAFRGKAVSFVTYTASDAALETQIVTLAGLNGVRFEACAVATRLFGVDNADILADINVVGNTFISAAGFGSSTKGYATVTIM
ncbi:hypothetical protein [Ferrimonas futtsuensis]|uniref:hypothetical protein n=1 Tax=Ferrimonas futtsuensis TaxID=364764 RepID=UPI00040AE14B|nr:hypothetical protein [Ferrimonas futtsuensis]